MGGHQSLNKRCELCGYRYEQSRRLCPSDGSLLGPADSRTAMLGPYRLVRRLREGGMGAVYRAEHVSLGRPVAIKLLHRSMARDRIALSRFLHEARAVNTVHHPHVIEIHDFVESDEDVYLVMELLEGRDLHDLLHSEPGGPIAPPRAVAILSQVAAALDAAHARGIIHRDVKPENVFLVRAHGMEDWVKLLDFGIAKLDRRDIRLTTEGALLGTPEYMAPEQVRGQAVDARTDVYGLGCTAFEALTGTPPFTGPCADVIARHLGMTPPRLRERVPDLPAALEDAVHRCLAKSRDARPETVIEAVESFAAAIAPRNLGARAPKSAGPRRWAAGGVALLACALGVAAMVAADPAPASMPVASAGAPHPHHDDDRALRGFDDPAALSAATGGGTQGAGPRRPRARARPASTVAAVTPLDSPAATLDPFTP